MDELAKEYFAELVHNEKARKNLIKLYKSGKLTDNKGEEIQLGNTVTYKSILDGLII